MDRNEFVRWLVLGEICDDYENVDQVILAAVGRTAAKCGVEVDRSDVVNALAGLIKDGLAKAYVLITHETLQYGTARHAAPRRRRREFFNLFLRYTTGNKPSSLACSLVAARR